MLKKKHLNEENRSIAGGEIEVAKPSISVATVFSIVGALFLVLVFAFYFFRYNSASPFYSYYNKPDVTAPSLRSSVQTGINKTEVGKPVELKITEGQIGTAVCISCDTFPLKKSTLTVKPEGIIISGKTTTAFWGVNLDITIKPKADNGKLIFDLVDFRAAGVKAPPKITESYSSKISDLFKNIIPADQSINISEVHSLVGSLLVIGRKK